MASLPTIYDLVLLLSTSAEEERRTQILGEVERTITAAAAGSSTSRPGARGR